MPKKVVFRAFAFVLNTIFGWYTSILLRLHDWLLSKSYGIVFYFALYILLHLTLFLYFLFFILPHDFR
jgi:hypothetical protein